MISPLEFFGHLVWIDGRPLPNVVQPYRRGLSLYSFNEDGEAMTHDRAVLTGV